MSQPERKKRKIHDELKVVEYCPKTTNCCGGGNNRFQQLAQHKYSSIPRPVPTQLTAHTNVIHISCGEDFTYFLTGL
jgi:alpha-tubulin suppressor-like RCC1 family protein